VIEIHIKMNKLKIAIDCDNVLFHNDIPEQVISDLNLNANISKIYHWELEELGEEGKAECHKRFSDPSHMCDLKPIQGNKKKIREWYKQGHELICVTARDLGIYQPTIDMIKQHYPEILNFRMMGSYNKSAGIYDCDVVIDDSHYTIQNAIPLRKIKKIFFVSNKKTPYNHDYTFKSKRVFKVRGLKDIDL